jgi:hypothetical protein
MGLETPADRKRENLVAAQVARAWNCEESAMGEYSPFDRFFKRGTSLLAIAEIKCRLNRAAGDFDTVFLNLDKWFSLMQAEIAFQLPSVYIIEFKDGIYWIRIGHTRISDCVLSVRGRKDRGKKNDVRPVIEIPTILFDPLEDP